MLTSMLRMTVIDNVFCFLKNNSIESVSLSKTDVIVEGNDSSLIETDDSTNLKRSRVTKYERKKIYSGKYKCSDCDYKCDRGRNIKIHKEVVHLNIKRFYCSYCTQKTYWKLNMIKDT